MTSIYLISPSGAVRDKAAVNRGIKRLRMAGHDITVDEAAMSSHQRFAGTDDERLAAIERAAVSGADVVMITRGGYGLTRLLSKLPYDAIAASIDKGTQWVGFSDFTAFSLAVLARTGKATWQGPAMGEDWGRAEGVDDIMQAFFVDLLSGQSEGTGWRLPNADFKRLPALAEGWHTDTGVCWGGNLSVLVSLLGTPFFPAIEGGLLFVEDTNEPPYRIERMLTQLLWAGVLDKQQALLFGQFNLPPKTPHDKGFGLPTVVDWLSQHTRTPILTGLPFGHVPTKVILPVGREVDLVVAGKEALLFWEEDELFEIAG